MIQEKIRKVFFLALFLPTTIVVAAMVLILGLLPGTEKIIRHLELFWARATVFASGIEIRLKWKGRPEEDQNYIFISNHQSYLDTPILLSIFSRHFPRFLAKDSLFKIPLFGPGMRKTGHLPINRDNRRKGMQDLQNAAERIKEGKSVLIFPEGTRNQDPEKLGEFLTGGFILALKTGLPLIPIVLDGTREVLPKGSIGVRPGAVNLCVLPSLDISRDYTLKKRDKLKQDLWQLMQNEYLEIYKWKMKNH